MTTPNSGKYAEKQHHSYIAGGNLKWYSCSRKGWCFFEIKQTPTVLHHDCIPECLF